MKPNSPQPLPPWEPSPFELHNPQPEPSLEASGEQCALCGLPVGRTKFESELQGVVRRFCCPGCMAVFQILWNSPGGAPADFKESDLYRACVAANILPTNGPGAPAAPEGGMRAQAEPLTGPEERENLTQELTLKIEGMWCSACAWVVEALLRGIRGVLEARVFFFSDLATIRYLPHLTTPSDVMKAVARLGYQATVIEDQNTMPTEKQRLLLRLGISGILTMNIMMIAFALYAGFFEELGENGVRYLSYPLWLLATPVVFYGGFPIFKRACQGLRFGVLSMDVLIAIGALSAYSYSVAMMLEGSLHLYFDTAAMLISLVLAGKYIESEARTKAARGLGDLLQLCPGKARLCRGSREIWVSSTTVRAGDEFLVRGEERLPLDGVILSGSADLDESILTGESRPVRRAVGSEVLAGSRVLNGQLLLRAARPAADSTLNQLRSLIHRALTEKNELELAADAVTRWLVPGVLLLAGATALFWRHHGIPLDQALLRSLSVLVITCPCALGIATPLARVAAVGVARSSGVVVQKPEAFEKAKAIDTLVFDKTGTLTEGKFRLCDMVVANGEREEALRRVASLEGASDHFVAREIVRQAGLFGLELEQPRSLEVFEGRGVKGALQGGAVCVGNARLMEEQKLAFPPPLHERAATHESRGTTVVFFGWEQMVQGFLAFGDKPRAEAKALVSELRAKGLDIWLVSGDASATTRAVAEDLGIQQVVGRALPVDKLNLVRKLQKEGKQVGVIGDGFNDAAALAQADLAIAFGNRVTVGEGECDMTILTKDLRNIPEVFRLSVLTTRVIRENLTFAFLYNIIGIPLAVAGMLNPLVAVSAMLASSLTVIGNTLRISKSPRPTHPAS